MSKGLAYYLQNSKRSKELSPESLNAWIHKYSYCQSLRLLKSANDYQATKKVNEEDLLYSTDKNHWLSQIHNGFSEITGQLHPSIQMEQQASNLGFKKASESIDESPKPRSAHKEIAKETKAPGPALQENIKIKVDPSEQITEPSLIESVHLQSEPPEVQRVDMEIAVKDFAQPEVEEKLEEISLTTSVSTKSQKTKKFIPQTEDEEIVLSPFAQWLLNKKQNPADIETSEASIQEEVRIPESDETDIVKGSQKSLSDEEDVSIQEVEEVGMTPAYVDYEEAHEEPKPDKRSQQNKDSIHDSVQQSNVIRQNIASETLAKLLWEQGHKDLAIKMYEKLILTNPEKSGFFAAQINKIRST